MLKRKAVSGILLTLLLASMLALAFDIQMGRSIVRLITVPDDYPTIQAAIDNANAGDTVFVRNGTYYEHVVVNKAVSLMGENCSTTIIDGNWTGVVIKVTQDSVNISGLTIRRSGSIYWENAGVVLDNVENCSISMNILTENSFAGFELNYSRRCSISGNSILLNGGVGMTLIGSTFNDLSRNSFVENGWSALTLNDGADNNIISENEMTSNNLAVMGHCINLYRSSSNTIQKNKITSDDNGIRLEYWSNYNMVSQNNITSNTGTGVSVEQYSESNTIYQNIICENGCGLRLQYSTQNRIVGNNIMENSQQVYLVGYSFNYWDDGYPSGGNYWSDYSTRYPSAQELDDSGIWNTPYNLDENNQDNYPLMEPWTPTPETVRVSVLIDYGNGTSMFHADVALLAGSSVLDATLVVAKVDYTSYAELGVFVNAINDVWNAYPYCWIWWYWDSVECTWILGPVASNQYALSNCEIVAWYYENTEIWPLPQPPWIPIEPVIAANINIDPDTLNLRSIGRWITAYIELLEGYDVNSIDCSSVLLNATIPAELEPVVIGDYDNDSVPDMIVTFNGTSVAEYMLSQGIRHGNAPLIVAGRLYDNTLFEGSDVIRVSDLLGDISCDGVVDINDIIIWANAFGSQPHDPNWNPDVNFVVDNVIDIFDAIIIAVNFGKTYP